jgi:DNA-binding NarL/FixJ family response regulator
MKLKTAPAAAPETLPVAVAEPAAGEIPKLRILLVDDHPITRQGIRALIDQQPDLEICGETGSATNAIELVQQLKPDLAIIDISLATMNGIQVTKTIKRMAPNLPILIVSMYDECLYAERALQAGAMGYVMKQEAGEKVAGAIRHLLRGETYLSPRMKEKLGQRSKLGETTYAIDTLSAREKEVFELIGAGFSTRQIAEKLVLSIKTIETYREHLKLKLGLDSGTELVRHAIQWAKADPAV